VSCIGPAHEAASIEEQGLGLATTLSQRKGSDSTPRDRGGLGKPNPHLEIAAIRDALRLRVGAGEESCRRLAKWRAK